jgi:hypothetical protein
MLDATSMVDPVLDRVQRRRGHRQSLCGDSVSNIMPLEEHGRDRNEGDLRDIIRKRHAWGQIENRHQERDRIEHEQCEEWDYDYYGPYYDQPHHRCSLAGGHNEGGD